VSISQSDIISRFYSDPLGYVRFMFPWGVSGSALEYFDGPDDWAIESLRVIGDEVKDRRFNFRDSVDPILHAVSSGHGIGKSAFVSWLVCWLMDTRVNCKGVITASTLNQLEKKTWPEISKWFGLRLVGSDWFEVVTSKNNLSVFRVGSRESWFFSGLSPNEKNSEAFAGQHNVDSSSIYIFDEASGVPDKIWSVAYGGLTDGEPHMYVFGNPTRKSGEFFDIFNDRLKHRKWIIRKVDSRSVRITNKSLLREWVETYGEDSDFVRIRVRGEFPSRGSTSLYDMRDVRRCVENGRDYLLWLKGRVGKSGELLGVGPDVGAGNFYVPPGEEALRGSLDVSRFGSDSSILSYRRGRDCVSVPWKFFDSMDLVDLSDYVLRDARLVGADCVMVDAIGVGAGVFDILNRSGGGISFFDVMGSRESLEKRIYVNKRTELHFKCAAMVKSGCYLPDNEDLIRDMEAMTFEEHSDGRLFVLSKKDLRRELGRSPDSLDSLSMSFDREGFARMLRMGDRFDGLARPPIGSCGWMGA